jgi:hypothetical protein
MSFHGNALSEGRVIRILRIRALPTDTTNGAMHCFNHQCASHNFIPHLRNMSVCAWKNSAGDCRKCIGPMLVSRSSEISDAFAKWMFFLITNLGPFYIDNVVEINAFFVKFIGLRAGYPMTRIILVFLLFLS